jgi:hypothetical protein
VKKVKNNRKRDNKKKDKKRKRFAKGKKDKKKNTVYKLGIELKEVKIKAIVKIKTIVYSDYKVDEDEESILTIGKKRKLVSKKLISYM